MIYKNKVALITGGAAGIGLAYAKEIIKHGAKGVAILDINQDLGNAAVKEIGSNKSIFIKTDVTNETAFEDAFQKTIAHFGGLDIVINNAGISDENKWELMIDVNSKAVVRGTLLGFKYMGTNNGHSGGIIVNTASILGVQAFAGAPTYSSTKHFTVAFGRSFGTDFYNKITGVKVYTICPSGTNTTLKSEFKVLDQFKEKAKNYEILMSMVPSQDPERLGEALTHILTNGENGSVWVVEVGKDFYEEKPARSVKA